MNSMTRALGIYLTQDRHAEQRQIADDVDDLVAHELVGEPQTLTVENSAFRRKHDRVIERSAPRQPKASQRLDLIQKSECPRRANLLCKLTVRYLDLPPLGADHRMRKFDQAGNLERARRRDTHATLAVDHLDSLQYAQELPRRLEARDARLLDHLYERLG